MKEQETDKILINGSHSHELVFITIEKPPLSKPVFEFVLKIEILKKE